MSVTKRGAVRIAIRTMGRVLSSGGSVTVADAEGIFVEHTDGLFNEGDVNYIRNTVDIFKAKVADTLSGVDSSSKKVQKHFTKNPLQCRNQAMEYGCEFDELSDSERLQYFDSQEMLSGFQFTSNIRSSDLEDANVELTITEVRLSKSVVLSRGFVDGKVLQVLKLKDRSIVFEPMLKVGDNDSV